MLKRLCVVSLASLALGTFTGLPAQAGIYVESGSKGCDARLKQAAEIGVRKHETPELAKEKNKDAILVLSFGTTYKDSRVKTIEKTVSDIQAAHPDVKTVLAFYISYYCGSYCRKRRKDDSHSRKSIGSTQKRRLYACSHYVSRCYSRYGICI